MLDFGKPRFYSSFNRGEWGYFWGGNTLPLKLSATTAHPSKQKSSPIWVVRRWRSGFEGDVTVSARFRETNERGDGVGALVVVDGSTVYSAQVGGDADPNMDADPNIADFSFTTSVRNGSYVDFILTPGPALDISFDGTGFSALITTPSPTRIAD